MIRTSFTRRQLGSCLITSLIVAILVFSTLKTVRAQDITLCAAPASALSGMYVTVNADQAQVNVRSGPNSYQYGKIGILFTYESAPALGRSPGGDWIQISCPGVPGGAGWVYAANVILTAQSELPVVEIPATPTPLLTSTVDPALAAEFPIIPATTTRLPTFTPAVPQILPSFTEVPTTPLNKSLQGALIIGIAILGMTVFLLSFFLKR
jgi:hypothetical protein